MRRSVSRIIMAVVTVVTGLAFLLLAAGSDHAPASAAVSPGLTDAPFQVVVQTMDSCKSGLAGAVYTLSNTQGYSQTVGVQGPSSPGGIGASATCPLQQGNCQTTTKGCLAFTNVPAGDYRLRQIATPSGNPSNPAGYAPCEGGSACQWQQADVTVTWDGSVGALVTNVYPNGKVVTWPSIPGHARYYAGTAADPIVFHDFGLAAPGSNGAQCDGDSDADDHLTGNMRGHCGYPEADEASACQPYPWSCASPAVATGAKP